MQLPEVQVIAGSPAACPATTAAVRAAGVKVGTAVTVAAPLFPTGVLVDAVEVEVDEVAESELT